MILCRFCRKIFLFRSLNYRKCDFMELSLLYEIQKFQPDWLDSIMIFITRLGNGGFVWLLLSCLFLLFRKTRPCGFLMMISMALGFLFGNIFLKNLFSRARPFTMAPEIVLKIPEPGGFSFPSGHTVSSFSAAGVIYMCHRKAGAAALFFASLIGFSRMYLFVHFPTDVLSGILIGGGIAFITVKSVGKRVL